MLIVHYHQGEAFQIEKLTQSACVRTREHARARAGARANAHACARASILIVRPVGPYNDGGLFFFVAQLRKKVFFRFNCATDDQ